MLLDLGRAVTFILSILSLYWVMLSAFFVPGTRWQERLEICLLRVAIAACICCVSGLLFQGRAPQPRSGRPSLLATPPVRLFFWGIGAISLLFAVSWYLEVYYLPWARKGS